MRGTVEPMMYSSADLPLTQRARSEPEPVPPPLLPLSERVGVASAWLGQRDEAEGGVGALWATAQPAHDLVPGRRRREEHGRGDVGALGQLGGVEEEGREAEALC